MTIDPSLNPYASPAADVSFVAPSADAAGQLGLATRSARFGAAMIDGLFAVLAFIPATIFLFSSGLLDKVKAGTPLPATWWLGSAPLQLATVGLWLALLVLQAYLVATTGRSIGKRALGIRIVKTDGQDVGFVNGVLLRGWLFHLVAYVPKIGPFLILIDELFIFGRSRRCLHDRLASTKVIAAPVTPR